MKKTMMLSIMTIAFISISFAAKAQTTNKEEDLIGNTVKILETGWMEKNGEKYASAFAEVHDFIVWNGYYFPNSNRQSTAAGHQALFNGMYKNQDIKLKIDKIKFIRSDIALVHALGGMYEKGKTAPENPSVIMTLLMEKKSGTWQIISFHNLDLEAFQNKETADNSPMPLSMMYAGWYKK